MIMGYAAYECILLQAHAPLVVHHKGIYGRGTVPWGVATPHPKMIVLITFMVKH